MCHAHVQSELDNWPGSVGMFGPGQGAVAMKHAKCNTHVLLIVLVLSAGGCAHMTWDAAAQMDTLVGYEAFLRDNPQSAYRDLATSRIYEIQARGEFDRLSVRRLASGRLEETEDESAYAAFLDKYPACHLSGHVRWRIQTMREDLPAWRMARSAGTVDACLLFLQQHPFSPYSAECRNRGLAMVCEEIRQRVASRAQALNARAVPLRAAEANESVPQTMSISTSPSATDAGPLWIENARAVVLVGENVSFAGQLNSARKQVTSKSVELFFNSEPVMGSLGGVFLNGSGVQCQLCLCEGDLLCNVGTKPLMLNNMELKTGEYAVFRTARLAKKPDAISLGNLADTRERFARSACLENPIIPPALSKFTIQDKNGDFLLVSCHKGIVLGVQDYAALNAGALGYTPLIIAAQKGHIDAVRTLIEHGADVNTNDWLGGTPLSCASMAGHTEIVKLLLLKGAKAGSSDILGLTPLHLASRHGYTEIVSLLLEYKANMNALDQRCKSPSQLAKENGHAETARLLKGHGALD